MHIIVVERNRVESQNFGTSQEHKNKSRLRRFFSVWEIGLKLQTYFCFLEYKEQVRPFIRPSSFFAHSRDSAMSYLNLLQILTLDNIYKFKLALFVHKIKNDPPNISTIFSGSLTLASEVHSYNTRFTINFNIYRPNINNNYK